MHLNAESLMCRLYQIDFFLHTDNIDIMALTEARVTNDIEDHEINITGYNQLRCNSENRHTGGIVCYIRNNINFEVMYNLVVPKMFWLLGFKVGRNCFIIVYRSPSSSIPLFLSELDRIMDEIIHLFNSNIYIMGDFNIDVSPEKKQFYGEKLIDQMHAFYFEQKTKEYTRITENSKSTVDLLFTNDRKTEVEVRRDPKITDHDMLFFKLDITQNNTLRNSTRELFKIRKVKDINSCDFEKALKNKTWEDNTNINNLIKIFNNNIIEVLNVMAPEITIRRKTGNAWYDKEVISLQKERDLAYKRAVLTNLEIDWETYRQLRNRVVDLIRYKKRSYFENVIDKNRGNSKEMWQGIKKILGKGKKEMMKCVFFEGTLIESDKSMAEYFNEYFVKSVDQIIQQNNHSGDAKEEDSFNRPGTNLNTFDVINKQKVIKLIKSLRKNQSVDEISKTVMLMGINIISEKLTNIINTSIQEGKFPEEWKTSIVVPIPKISNAKMCEEYRPINMLPLCEEGNGTVCQRGTTKPYQQK